MKIKILSGVICGGKRRKEKDVVDAADKEAKFLVAIGKAEFVGKNSKPDTDAPAPAPAPK